MKTTKHSWSFNEIQGLFELPFMDLLYQAHQIHRQHFHANALQVSTLLSIKTGSCPEDCAYCPQSAHYKTNIEKHRLLSIEVIKAKAKTAKKRGAQRFCMGAAWRHLPTTEIDNLTHIIKKVKALGLETCMTLGMLEETQAKKLAAAGLDYYNHNLDTSPEYYSKIITTRTYADRLKTLQHIREAGIKVCCGGIIGLGESQEDRIKFLQALVNLSSPPESVPINLLEAIPGTPLANTPKLDPLECVRVIAVARMIMPKSVIRLTAGRNSLSDETQTLCFFAGANSIFFGEKLLTTDNPSWEKDQALLAKLQIRTLACVNLKQP